jgi:hypothetical protein
MTEHRPSADDVTIEKAVKHLFPEEARDAARLGPKQEPEGVGEAGTSMDARAEEHDSSAKSFALQRLSEAPDEELAVFEDSLRQGALDAGATEQELRDAQSGHPGHC